MYFGKNEFFAGSSNLAVPEFRALPPKNLFSWIRAVSFKLRQ